MASFGDWQKHLDLCLNRLLNDSKQLESFKICEKNEDRILFVRKSEVLRTPWIENYFQTACFGVKIKSSDVAQLARKEGNNSFEKKDFMNALCCYNQCILFAPNEDEERELSLGFANRSAVHFHLKKYQACLSDIQSALDNGYPANLGYKLILRKAQCLACLGQWKEVKSVLELAKEESSHLSSADVKKNAGFLKEVDSLLARADGASSVENQGNVSNVLDSKKKILPLPIDGYGDILKQASSAIDLHFCSTKGRHIVSNRKIKAGDVLMVEPPYAAVLLPSHYLTNCHNCFSKVDAIIPCCGCTSVVYCSWKCRMESWTNYHSIECSMLALLQSVGIAHLSLRIVLLTQLENLLDFRAKNLASPNGSNDGAVGLTSDGSYRCNYLSVYHLMPHTDDMLVEDLYQYSLTAALLLSCLEKSDFFDSLENFKAKDDQVLFIGGLLLRHICQLVCNAHAITDLELTQFSESSLVDVQSQVRVATAIYPTASLMNHSCDPTIISSFHNDTLVVRAVKDVEAGQEIFNCYGPHCKRMACSDRQRHLREQYFFDCQCEPCLDGIVLERRSKALKCCHCEGPLIFDKGETFICIGCNKNHFNKDIPWNDLQKADDLFKAGLHLLEQRNIDDAIVRFQSCLKIRKANLHRRNRDLSEVQDALARCRCIKGDFLSAYKLLTESVQTTEELFGSSSIELANELQKYGDVCLNAGKLEDAITVASRALDLFTLNYGRDSEPVLELKNFVNLCLEAKCSD